ncbi:unnamed protein product [Moneuplotes crassus]|uniref:Uncharacterized protein n=1 Tax=Euplotes crassus TaxID=5936 RepID=A0AAD1XYV6_EUPCR|nr:unnamed protein product [Moneuplotes crassus]
MSNFEEQRTSILESNEINEQISEDYIRGFEEYKTHEAPEWVSERLEEFREKHPISLPKNLLDLTHSEIITASVSDTDGSIPEQAKQNFKQRKKTGDFKRGALRDKNMEKKCREIERSIKRKVNKTKRQMNKSRVYMRNIMKKSNRWKEYYKGSGSYYDPSV